MSDSPYIVEVNADNFQQVVLEGSHRVPVLVDFWASWCQPCQVLMPLLARLADDYQGKFLLAKVNTEENQEIAARFGIRSIPTVKLFKEGEEVDEFMGALPEGEIRRFLDRHVPRASDALVAQARERLLEGDAEAAMQLLERARSEDPGNPRVTLAIAQAQAATGEVQAAEATLDALPLEEQEKPEVQRLRGHLHFESVVAQAPPAQALEARLAEHPEDSEARYQLAAHRVLAQDYEGAIRLLLELMQRDRGYGDDAARRALIRLFDLLGDDPLVARYRGRMFALLH